MKKRLLSTLLALCMVLSLLPGTAWAERPSGSSGDGVTWLYDMESTLIIQGTGPMKDYGTDMLPPWYDHRYQIHTVIIGDGVTSIGDRAFYYLENLESITIPNSVTSIGEDVFIGCDSLTSISIPDSVTSIGQWTFSWCSSLTSINVASGNPAYTSVDGILFNVGQTLLHTYPAGKSGTSYDIPASVTRIGGGAFGGCSNLTNIDIPNSVTSIGSYAFSQCDNLTSIVIPTGVTRIEEHTFEYCGNLTNVNIPDSVTSIGDYAFDECNDLTSVNIPNRVTSIGQLTFSFCTSLTSISIPAGVNNIGAGAFWKCSSLKDVYYSGSESQWKQISIDSTEDGNAWLLRATIHYGDAATPDPDPEGSVASVSDVTLDKTSLDLTVGDSEKLVAKITYINAFTNLPDVTWTSSDESVVTVRRSGSGLWGLGASVNTGNSECTVTAVGAGTATITVTATTADGDMTATCTVTVKYPPTFVTDVTLDKTSLDLTVGDSEKLTAAVTYYSYNNAPNVTWTSSDESVATFDWSGYFVDVWRIGLAEKITGTSSCTVKTVGAGTATITVTATTESGSKTATCTVTVSDQTGADPKPAPEEGEAAVITAAGQTTYHPTLEDAVEYSYTVRRGGTAATVQMLADYSEDHANGKTGLLFYDNGSLPAVTLDLNGHSFVGPIGSSENLIITDSAGDGMVNGTIENYGRLEIAGGTFRGKLTSEEPGLEIPSRTIISGGTILFDYIIISYGGRIEISGGETILNEGVELFQSDMILSGGMFKGYVKLLTDVYPYINYAMPTLTITDGTLFGNIYCDSGVDSGNLTITGGTLCNVTENGQLWSLTNKILTISGTGAIPDYDSHLDVPWDYLTDSRSWYVESIVVEEGITRIGDHAFAFYGGKTLTLPNTVTSLGEYSIGFTSYSDDHITYLEIPASVTRIEAGTFDYTKDLMVKFLGSAPVFSKDTPVFDRSSDITIYYPAGDASWVPYAEATPPATLGAEKITWIAYGSEYQVTVPAASNGVVTVTPKSAKSGEKVTVTAAPDKGYVVDKITVALADGNEVKVTDNGDGTYSFTMPAAAVTVTATFKAVETNITISNTAGGTVTSNAANAKKGDTVTLTSKANAGYISAVPTVKDKDGKAVTVTRNADGTYTFIMPEGGVTITGNYMTPAQMFSDVDDSKWYRNDLSFAIEHGLISGYNGKFDPSTALTRGMMVTLLYNLEVSLEGKPTAPSVAFNDVQAGQYYTDAVAWASYNGIVEGYNNNFNPNGVLDRQQMATILYNYAAYKGYNVSGSADLSGYTDAGSIASWALAGMRWANSADIVTGSNSALNPTGTSDRTQGAVLLAKFCREVVGMA